MTDLSGKKILIAEDDIYIQFILESMISEFKAEALFANDGEEAIRLFKSEKFDLVLLDIFLPIINGRRVLKEIKKIDRSIPVIAQTASDERLENGFNDFDAFIQKPFNYDSLRQVLSQFF